MSPHPVRIAFIVCAIGFSFSIAGFFIGRATVNPTVRESLQIPVGTSALPPFSASESSQNTAASPSISHILTPSDWKTLLAASASPATEQNLLASLRALAATNPTQAIELAQNAPTPRQRDEFIRAVLRGWGSSNPRAAAEWALAHVRLGERRLAFEALIAGAIVRPEEAIRATLFLCTADPLLQSDHGHALISALTRGGHFDLATQFATSASGDFRAYWLSTAFSNWAQYQPSNAIAAASKLADPAARVDALQGVITGWAASDPAALVAYAEKIPAAETRAAALRDGLQQWVSLDPVAASAWMDRLEPSRDLDPGAAAVATTPVIVEKKPDVATSWAESIVDPQLRSDTLLDLIRLWSTTDPVAARSYAANSPALRPEAREVALSSFQQLIP